MSNTYKPVDLTATHITETEVGQPSFFNPQPQGVKTSTKNQAQPVKKSGNCGCGG